MKTGFSSENLSLCLFSVFKLFEQFYERLAAPCIYHLAGCHEIPINTDRFQMMVWNERFGFYYIGDQEVRLHMYFSGNHDFQHVSSYMNLLLHPEQAPRSSQVAAEAARPECRARPSEMFTFQLWVVFNHPSSCLTARSTAWPLFTSPCFRPASYSQSGRPRDDLSGQLLRLSAKQQCGQAEQKAAWRYTEYAPVWLTQSA